MKRHIIIFILFSGLILNSCSVAEKSQRSVKYSFQGGINKGGITENSDFSVLPNATDENLVDAYSGATKIGVNAGVHINKPLKYGEIESGLDFIYNAQTFTYSDQQNNFSGVRKLNVNQLMIPLTYNFDLLKKALPEAELQLKLGFLGQLNFVSVSNAGTLPEYAINNFSGGGTFGIATYPIKFQNGSKLGFYIDAYRGSQIYEDEYNQPNFEMPGSSFVKGGIRYQFK